MRNLNSNNVGVSLINQLSLKFKIIKHDFILFTAHPECHDTCEDRFYDIKPVAMRANTATSMRAAIVTLLPFGKSASCCLYPSAFNNETNMKMVQ